MRYALRSLVLLLLGVLASGIGMVLALTLTPPGRALLAQNVEVLLADLLDGEVRIGRITGSFLRDLRLDDVVIRDTDGLLLAQVGSLDVQFNLPGLLRQRFVFDSVVLERPVINLVRHHDGRWNYQEVLRIGGPKRDSGPPDLIELQHVRIDDGAVAIAYPWPADELSPRQRDSVIAAARAAVPRRMVASSSEGTRRIIAISGLAARLERLRISSPERKPLLVVLDSARADVSDPFVQVRDAQGVAEQAGDSLRLWLPRAVLPHSVASVEGTLSWPDGPLLLDVKARATQLDLADLQFISPLLPRMTGRGTAIAKWESNTRTAYDLRDLVLVEGDERIAGSLVAVVDSARGLGVRRLKLALAAVSLEKVRPFLDTLPFAGRLSGTLEADGWLDDLVAKGDWVFDDATVPGGAVNRVAFSGRVRSGPGLTFEQVAVSSSDLDLRSVRNLAPTVPLLGRLRAVGTVDGSLDNASFTGTVAHQDGTLPPSEVQGYARLDTRSGDAVVSADLVLQPLALDGIRPAYPTLPTRGELRGRVLLEGSMAALTVDADVTGEIGAVQVEGVLTLLPPRFAADGLRVAFRRLDLQALSGRGVPTSLEGLLAASGTVDSGVPPLGTLRLLVDGGSVRGINVDSALVYATSDGVRLTVDTLAAELAGVLVAGSGTLGWQQPARGEMRYTVSADSLNQLDSLALATAGLVPDTSSAWRALDGVVRGELSLRGSLDSLEADGTGSVNGLVFERARLGRLGAAVQWRGGSRPTLVFTGTIDSLGRGEQSLRRARLELSGPADSLQWHAASTIGSANRVATTGRLWGGAAARRVGIDSLRLDLPSGAWRLDRPGVIAFGDGVPRVDPLRVAASDGRGEVRVAGSVPWNGPGAFELEANGVELRDLYALAQLDTAGVGGTADLRLELGGTDRAPVISGAVAIEDLRLGETMGPFAQALFRYEERELQAGLTLWRTGDPVLLLTARLPLDLALRGAETRKLPGPIEVRARADSVDLAVIEALSTSVGKVRGLLRADVRVGGTWARPDLDGAVELTGGEASIAGLNTRFTGVAARASLGGDSIVVERFEAKGGAGRAEGEGVIKLASLTSPILDLRLRAQRFRVMNRPDYLELTATAALQLRGPLTEPLLTGGAVAEEGALQFADLVSKRVIDLDDPANAAFVDTTTLRKRKLGSDLRTRLVQALRIEDLNLVVGESFWLRSSEANIKLRGDVLVNKDGRTYRVDGTMTAERGRYSVFTKDFDVVRGDVRFFGTPDLNAGLDIEAQHVVRTTRNEELPITARVTGTLLAPKLRLSGGARTNIPESDLFSYLIAGRPASEAGTDFLATAGLSYALGLASNELERALISDLGLPIDMLQIRPLAGTGGGGATGALALSAGWQLGARTFLSLNAGFCPNSLASFDYRNIGAAVEYRFNRQWKAQVVMEPVLRFCGVTNLGANVASSQLYQFGTDVLWQREF